MRTLSLTVLLMLVAGPALASDGKGLNRAETLLRSGRYAEAEAAFGALLRTPDRDRALLGLSRLKLVTADATAALATAGKVRGPLASEARILQAEAQLGRGKPDLAEQGLAAETAARPRAWRAWVLLGIVHTLRGKPDLAKAAFERLYDAYDDGTIRKEDRDDLVQVAQACRYTDNYRDAADLLTEVLASEPMHEEALLILGEMSLEKYEAGHAEVHFNKVLKQNPHHPRALVGLARVKLEQGGEVEAAEALLGQALAVAPSDIEARLVQASILLDAERWEAAEARLQEALATCPGHLHARALLGASLLLRDDQTAFNQLRLQVLANNPVFSGFDRIAAVHAVRHHRYAEAIALLERAIATDPHDWSAMAELGTNHLRLGDDEVGLKLLRRAWEGDRFNVRTFNLLNLYEEVLLKEYLFMASPHFRLRVHRSEAELLRRTVVPLLEEAYALYTAKYRFTPSQPITVELFADPAHYAVRTVGLPGLAALGVCFGRVITSVSPLAGRFNWGQVLWHELNHVFTIQLSRSRVPRWLTEGLADLEPELRRSEWRRENDLDIYLALSSGRLRSVADMNTAFVHARSIEEIVVAYYQGSLMARFLVENYGLPKVLRALVAFAEGQRTHQVLPAVTGLSLERLDQQFRTAQTKRLLHYQKSFIVDKQAFRDLTARQAAARARPTEAAAREGLAMAWFVDGKLDRAVREAEAALALEARSRHSLYVLAQAALARRKPAEAETLLRRLIAAGGDGFEARFLLGTLALDAGNLVLAEKELDRAAALDPERPEPHALLARAFEKAGQRDKATDRLKRFVLLDQQQLAPAMHLLEELVRRGDQAGVRQFGELTYYIHPGLGPLHLWLSDAYLASAPTPDPSKALWHLETALLCSLEKPGPAYLKLAQLHAQQGRKPQARKALDKAKQADPNLTGIKDLQEKLK